MKSYVSTSAERQIRNVSMEKRWDVKGEREKGGFIKKLMSLS